jgi:hypothetical protein
MLYYTSKDRRYTMLQSQEKGVSRAPISASRSQDFSEMKRADVLDLFREQQRLKELPTYSGNFQSTTLPGSASQWSGRRASQNNIIRKQIQADVYGEDLQEPQQDQKEEQDYNLSPSPIPPASQPPSNMSDEVQHLRAQLEEMKLKNDISAEQIRVAQQSSVNQSFANQSSAKSGSDISAVIVEEQKSKPSNDISRMIEAIKASADLQVKQLLAQHSPLPSVRNIQISAPPAPATTASAPATTAPATTAPATTAPALTADIQPEYAQESNNKGRKESIPDLSSYLRKVSFFLFFP